MRYITGLLVVVALAVGLLTWSARPAAAEYPPPIGSVSAAASDTTPAPGSTVQVTCTALDSSGQPMAGVPCEFSITSQPGGASFDGALSTTKNTDENGVATAVLSMGSEPGVVVVSVESGGIVSQVTMTAGAPQGLPTTGGAPGARDSSPSWPVLAGLGAAAAIALAGGLLVGRVGRQNS